METSSEFRLSKIGIHHPNLNLFQTYQKLGYKWLIRKILSYFLMESQLIEALKFISFGLRLADVEEKLSTTNHKEKN